MSDASSEIGGDGGAGGRARGLQVRPDIAQMHAQVHLAGRNLCYPAPVTTHDGHVDTLTPTRYPVPSSRTNWQVFTTLKVQFSDVLCCPAPVLYCVR